MTKFFDILKDLINDLNRFALIFEWTSKMQIDLYDKWFIFFAKRIDFFEFLSSNDKTLSIKKYSINSFDANDRSKKISINFVFRFLKIDKFNQYLIHVSKKKSIIFHFINHQTFSIFTVVALHASQSLTTCNFYVNISNCKVFHAFFNDAKIT